MRYGLNAARTIAGSGRSLAGSASALAFATALLATPAMAAPCGTTQNVSSPCDAPVTPASGTFENSSTITGGFNFTTVNVAGDVTISDFTNTATGVIDGTNIGSNSGSAVVVDGKITTFTNAGKLLSDGSSIAVNASGAIGTIDNQAGAEIGANATALFAFNGIGVDGGSIGTINNAGSIAGHYTAGISLTGGGSIGAINNTGTISTDITGGIYSYQSTIGTITNSGTITGGYSGLYNGYGSITEITNTGTISGGNSGIDNNSGTIGTLTNSGTISGRYSGISNYAGTITTLSNSGTISGGIGVALSGGDATIGTLANSGNITGTSTGVSISTGSIDKIENAVGGVISGSESGIYNLGSINTLNNAGSIESEVFAIRNDSAIGTLSNSGTITSGSTGLLNYAGSINAVMNGGEINGLEFGIVNNVVIGAVSNGGMLNGGSTGLVNYGSISSISNTGTIQGEAYSGIYSARGSIGSIENASGAVIYGDTAGIYNATSIDAITNNGLIDSNNWGIYSYSQIGSITNSGTINSDGSYAIYNSSGNIDALTNNGTIHGALSNGIYNSGGRIGVLTNGGTITGAYAAIYNSGEIPELANTGTIAGTDNGLYNNATITSLINGGTIAGQGAFGINNSGGAIDTLVNMGSIAGSTAGIYNTGTIGNVTNAQGGLAAGGTLAPLSVSGNMITGGYTAHITSPTHYAQLAYTGGNGELASFTLTPTSVLAKGTYQDVLTGITIVSGAHSGTVNRFAWTLLEDAANAGNWDLVVTLLGPDVANTLLELGFSRDEVLKALRNRAALVSNGLANDCGSFGQTGVCLGFSVDRTELKDQVETAGTFSAAVRLSPQLRAGVFVEVPMSLTSNLSRVERKGKNAMFGGFFGFSQQPDGTGIQARVSGATHAGDVSIARPSDLQDTEAGTGNARVKSWAVGAELGFGVKLGAQTHFTPYLGLQHVSVNREGYAEAASGSVAFPIGYADYGQRTTTGRAGIAVSGKAGSKIRYRIGAGFEFDLASRSDAFAGTSTIDGLGTFSLANTAGANKFRGNGSVELAYEVLPGIGLTVGASARGEAFTDKTSSKLTAGVRFGF